MSVFQAALQQRCLEYRSQVISLRSQQDTCQAVQKDFVQLSQSLQVLHWFRISIEFILFFILQKHRRLCWHNSSVVDGTDKTVSSLHDYYSDFDIADKSSRLVAKTFQA